MRKALRFRTLHFAMCDMVGITSSINKIHPEGPPAEDVEGGAPDMPLPPNAKLVSPASIMSPQALHSAVAAAAAGVVGGSGIGGGGIGGGGQQGSRVAAQGPLQAGLHAGPQALRTKDVSVAAHPLFKSELTGACFGGDVYTLQYTHVVLAWYLWLFVLNMYYVHSPNTHTQPHTITHNHTKNKTGLPFLDKLRQVTGPFGQTISQRFTQQRAAVNVEAGPPQPDSEEPPPLEPPPLTPMQRETTQQPGSTPQGTNVDWNSLVKELRERPDLPKPWSTLTVEQKMRAVKPMDVMCHMKVSTYLEVRL